MERKVGQMKIWKAGGPAELAGEIICAAGQTGMKKTMKIRDMVMDEGSVLRDWELDTLTLIYKG